MDKFNTLCSKAISLPELNVDTDLIISAQYLTTTSKQGLGSHLFESLRKTGKDFLPASKKQTHSILVVGANFGCGSSREHAVWALQDWGFKAIVAPSFADIFTSNALKNGLVLVAISESDVELLWKENEVEDFELTIDLESQILRDNRGHAFSFAIDAFRKHCILRGQDDMDYLLANKDRIEQFKKKSIVPLTI